LEYFGNTGVKDSKDSEIPEGLFQKIWDLVNSLLPDKTDIERIDVSRGGHLVNLQYKGRLSLPTLVKIKDGLKNELGVDIELVRVR